MSIEVLSYTGLCTVFEATSPNPFPISEYSPEHQQGYRIENHQSAYEPLISLESSGHLSLLPKPDINGRGSRQSFEVASTRLCEDHQSFSEAVFTVLEAGMIPGSRSGGHYPEGGSALPQISKSNLSIGTSKSSSPVSQQTPEVVLTKAEHDSDDEEGLSSFGSGSDENAGGEEGSKSAAERLAEKRRMKRFRLNHVQTRYLMNEFARQPHPDAAQRERLSHEIPGLKPRQVQVWFQNRRAKMKRLTTDDQERMMRSRALPEDFDLSQSLHPGSRRPSLGPVPTLSNLDLGRPATSQRPTLSLVPDHGNVPLGSMASVYGSFSPITGSATGSRNISPVSAYSGSHFPDSLSPVNAAPQFGQLGRSNSFSTGFPASQHEAGRIARASTNRRRAETFTASEQQYPLSAGGPPPYNDLHPWDYQRRPLQPSESYRPAPLQHSNTFPAGLSPMPSPQSISPLSSPTPYLYEPSQTNYSQPTTSPGYYSASYTQNLEVTGPWQAPFPSAEVGGHPQLQATQYSTDAGFSSDPSFYNQIGHRSSRASPSVYAPGQMTLPSQQAYQASAGQTPNNSAGRRRSRGNTYPTHYSDHR